MDLLHGSLVVTQAGHKDFQVFGLTTGDWDTFDLQHKFLQQTGEDKYGEPVMQPISLRRLVLHFFGEDIQAGVHSAEKDAIYTMKLFKIYQELARKLGMKRRSDQFPIDQFADVKKIPKPRYARNKINLNF